MLLFPRFSVKGSKLACVLYVELEMSFFCSKSNNRDFWTVTFSRHFLKKAKKKSEDCCWMMNYNYFDESFRNFHASAFINSISIFLLESINFCSSSVISTADDMFLWLQQKFVANFAAFLIFWLSFLKSFILSKWH